MSFYRKLSARRLVNGALLAGAIVLAWRIERPEAPAASDPAPAAAAAVSPASQPPHRRGAWWWAVARETYDEMARDRLLAVAAGVVFYALLAVFPAVTAFVSFYGLFADAGTIQDHLALLANVLPADSLAILREQIVRIAAKPSGLGVGVVVGLLIALWSANAGVKALIDALNVIQGRTENRTFVRFNLLSLAMTLGAIAFLLLAVGAVVGFPLAMSAFGLKDATATATWLIRWPLLLGLMIATLSALYRFGPSRGGPASAGGLRRLVTPGAAIAAVAWLAGSAALSFYLSHFADYNATYGSLGAAIGLMMWMWLSTIAVLAGAQIDSVLDRRALIAQPACRSEA
jgi:membrane protein